MAIFTFVSTWGLRVFVLVTLGPSVYGLVVEDASSTAEFLGLPLRSFWALAAIIGLFVVNLQLVAKQYLSSRGKPKFEVGVAKPTHSMRGAVRLVVQNTSGVSAIVSTRTQGVQDLTSKHGFGDLVATHETEPYIGVWEESTDQNLTIQGRNHGTLSVGVMGLDDHGRHCLMANSYRYGELNSFPFAPHNPDQGGFEATLTVVLFADPDLRGRREWAFEIGDSHKEGESGPSYWVGTVAVPTVRERVMGQVSRVRHGLNGLFQRLPRSRMWPFTFH